MNRIDTLVLSHADIDHFGGSLDVLDQVPVGRVLVAVYFLQGASARPGSAADFLIEQIDARGVPVQVVMQGYAEHRGSADLDFLWPPPGLVGSATNDTSLVLRIVVSGKRIVMCGDIQKEAIRKILNQYGSDVHADICDLPHHGSFIEDSPRWLTSVSPQIVLQSAGYEQLRNNPWKSWLDRQGVRRFMTARHGMVELQIDHRGTVSTDYFMH